MLENQNLFKKQWRAYKQNLTKCLTNAEKVIRAFNEEINDLFWKKNQIFVTSDFNNTIFMPVWK